MAYFTMDDISNPSMQPNSTACAYDINLGAIVPGHAWAEPIAIANHVGLDRVQQWVVHALNMLIEDHGRPTVDEALRSAEGLKVRSPLSAGELEAWDRWS